MRALRARSACRRVFPSTVWNAPTALPVTGPACERIASRWSAFRLRLSGLLVYLAPTSPSNESPTAIRDRQMTAKPKMGPWEPQASEMRETRKTTGRRHIACAVDWPGLW